MSVQVKELPPENVPHSRIASIYHSIKKGGEVPIRIVHEGCLIDALFGDRDHAKRNWDEESEALIAWVAAWDAFYYCRPGEDFCVSEGLRLAVTAGKSLVVMENLS